MKTRKKYSPAEKQCFVASKALNKASRAFATLEVECFTHCKSMQGRTHDMRSLLETIELMMCDLGRDIFEATKKQTPS